MHTVPPDSTQTRRLLDQARAGDRAAFEALFARHRAELRRFVALRLDARLRARVDPSDVVQETQLEAFRRLPDFLERAPMPFHVWVRRTAYERLLMLRRQHVEAERRATGREVALPDRSSLLLAERLVAHGPSPSRSAERRELARQVRQVLLLLPEADRELLFLRTFEGLSYEESADILGIEPATARKRHGRALLKLHALLKEHGLTDLLS
jgi:RNA polymerase sigma-70 factor (ECF subfamily)